MYSDCVYDERQPVGGGTPLFIFSLDAFKFVSHLYIHVTEKRKRESVDQVIKYLEN